MIKRHIQYTKEHKEKIQNAYKDFIKPQYLGEDEVIAVRALYESLALEKIRKAEMEFGEKTKEEVEREIKLKDITYGWLQLVDDENKNHENITADGNDCFVSFEETSDYPVFVYAGRNL